MLFYSPIKPLSVSTVFVGVAVRGDGGVDGEGRIVGVSKFHSWGKCTMPLTNINSATI